MYAGCVRTLKGLALPCASHSDKIALSGSRHLRSTLAGAAPVLLAHAIVTVKLLALTTGTAASVNRTGAAAPYS